MAPVKRIIIVLAQWCPHCVPLSTDYGKKMAQQLNVPLTILDIDEPKQLEEADRLIEEHGDACEDYLIPQVFLEHTDRKIEHVLTGFSESVSATEDAWKKLLTSQHYKTLLQQQQQQKQEKQGKEEAGSGDLRQFAEKHLSFEGKCSRHCNQPTKLVPLKQDKGRYIGAYVCPDGCVTRVIQLSTSPDTSAFKKFLASQLGRAIKDRDIRVATRHGWELKEAETEIWRLNPAGTMTEAYWSTHPTTEAEKSRGIFLCTDPTRQKGCGKLFTQDIKSNEKLCPDCR